MAKQSVRELRRGVTLVLRPHLDHDQPIMPNLRCLLKTVILTVYLWC